MLRPPRVYTTSLSKPRNSSHSITSPQNADGTKGANVVMSKADAQAKGLTHYKADPAKLNAVVAGMNDVQNKLNQLADVVTDPKRMGQVDPVLAVAMLSHGTGITLNFGGHGGGASGGIG